MPTSQTFLSLVVPAYNESATIATTLCSIRQYLHAQPWGWEVIISADGNDGTRERAAEFASSDARFAVIGSSERRGKGHGVRAGVLRATGSIIGFLDADYKTPIEELARLLPAFGTGCDVVIGSRRAPGARIEQVQPFFRRLGSRAFGRVVRRLLKLPEVGDTQCGFKFFSQSAARTLFSLQRIDGYMFDVEVLRLCALLNLRVEEVGVRWRDDGDSRYEPIVGTLRNVRELWRIGRMHYELPASSASTGPIRRAA